MQLTGLALDFINRSFSFYLDMSDSGISLRIGQEVIQDFYGWYALAVGISM